MEQRWLCQGSMHLFTGTEDNGSIRMLLVPTLSYVTRKSHLFIKRASDALLSSYILGDSFV